MRFTTQSIVFLSLFSRSTAQVTPCISIGGWSFRATAKYNVDDEDDKSNDIQCTYNTLLDAFEDQIFPNDFLTGNACENGAEDEFLAQLGVSTIDEGKVVVYDLCKSAQDKMRKIPISDVSYSEGSQFIELYYSGHASWNEETETQMYPGEEETPFNVLEEDAQLVDTYYEHSQKSAFAMPDLPQFEPDLCTANAAMCCWPRDRQANDNNGNCDDPYDEECVDKDVADNTDLCYVELTHAPYANGVDADGFSLFPNDNHDGEGPIHCHGFAWADDDQEILSRYKANNLFYVSMYDHMYQRGYVENIPGAPMCGCVEHMPVVSRSDCTQTNLDEYYTFTKKSTGDGFTGVVDRIKLAYDACQGADNNNNDLAAFVQQLVNDEKLNTTHQDIFKERVVGNHQCDEAITDVLESHSFEKGFNVDESKWTFIVGEQFDEEVPTYDARMFKAMFEAQDEDFRIVRRVCPTCDESHKDVYYKRLTSMPDDFDLLDTLMNNWFEKENELDVDFSLYSTYMDAYYDENRWTFCNFGDAGIGFPRNCGPTGEVHNNWNSYYRGGGRATHHAFMIPSNSSFDPSVIINIASEGTALQSSTHHIYEAERAIDGNTVGIFNDYFQSTTHTHTSTDPWWQVNLGHYSLINKVYFWNRIDCCRDRLNGAVVSVHDLILELEVASISISDANVMNVVDFGGVEGHAVRISLPGSGKILSLAEVQIDGVLGDFAPGNVKVKYYDVDGWTSVDSISESVPYKSDYLYNVDFTTDSEIATSNRRDVGAEFSGYVAFIQEGFYDICVTSDDGSKLFIDNQLAIDNDGVHGAIEKCIAINKSGDGKELHKLTTRFFDSGGRGSCIIKWKTPDMLEYQVIPPSAWEDSSDFTPTVSPTPAPTPTNDIKVTYFDLDDTFDTIPDNGFDGMTSFDSSYIATIDYPQTYGYLMTSGRSDYVGALFEANLSFNNPGVYDICIESNDGSKVYIDDELKIEDNGIHGMRKKCFTAFFDIGLRKIVIQYFEYNHHGGIVVTWKPYGEKHDAVIPAQAWSLSYTETE